MAALVLLLDVQHDGRGVLSSHNKVPSLFLAAVTALIALAQDDDGSVRPSQIRDAMMMSAETRHDRAETRRQRAASAEDGEVVEMPAI